MASIVRLATVPTALVLLVLQLLYCCLQTGANAAPTASCPAGYMSCGSNHKNGCLTNVKTDLDNCGSCEVKCNARPHSSLTCSDGKCGFTCSSKWWKDCDQKEKNGCEMCVQGDVRNCGDCGKRCDCPPHAISTCVSGSCGFSCKVGFKDCNKLAADGCEVAIASDVSNCGACGTACSTPNARPKCTNGTCAIKGCHKGFSDCNGVVKDGCEVTDAMLQTDPLNCGACGKKCDCLAGGRTPACAGGICTCKCRDGIEDCNGSVDDGCEAEVAIDVANCGGCGKACNPANANPRCSNGTCGIESCKSGYSDCNGLAGDGCEVTDAMLQTGPLNCGACGKECALNNAYSRCSNGTCEVESCKSRFRDCNALPADGCEETLDSCGGACGGVCVLPNAHSYCENDEPCAFETCHGGFDDCNELQEDGCEIDISTDPFNCGLCQRSCRTDLGFLYCRSGTCSHCDSDADCVNNPHKKCEGSYCGGASIVSKISE